MAKISNTTAYPNQSPVSLSDYLIGTDAATLSTKTFTVQDLADAIDDTVTLQEVLQTGSTATGNTGNTWAGDMSLTQGGSLVLPQIARKFEVNLNGLAGSGNKTGYLIGNLQVASNGAADAGDIDASGSLELGGSAVIGTSLEVTTTSRLTGKTTIGNVAAITGNPDLKVGNSIKFEGGIGSESAFTIGSEYDGLGSNPSDFGGPYIQFTSGAGAGVSLINQGTGAITIGRSNGVLNAGTISVGDGNTTQLTLESTGTNGNIEVEASDGVSISNTTSGNITIENSANPGQIIFTPFTGNEILLNGRTNAVSYIDFQANNGIRLNGASGVAGELIKSQGAGLPLVWAGEDDLNVLSSKKVIVNATTSTGPIAIGDPLYISGVEVGNRFTVSKADASDPLKMPVVGLAVEAVAGASGNFTMIVNGDLAINTGTITGGAALNDVVYVAPAGGLTVTRPTAVTDLVQNVGIVSDTGANGAVKVTATGRTNDTPNVIDRTKRFEVTDDRAGSENVTFGAEAFASATVGSRNTAIGFQAAEGISGTSNVAVGNANGKTGAGNSNVSIGYLSLDSGSAGNQNIGVGVGTLSNTNASAEDNVAVGHNALNSLTSATKVTSIGSNSLFSLTTGEGNVGVGFSSLSQVSTAVNNTAVGYQAGFLTTAENNTFIGYQAGNVNTSGTSNVMIGQGANGPAAGDLNIVIGDGLVTAATTGSVNIGSAAGSTGGQSADGMVVIGRNIDATDGASIAGVGGSVTIGSGQAAQPLTNAAVSGVLIGSTALSPSGLTANADGSIAIGNSNTIDSASGIAIGGGATINALSGNSIAIGTTSIVGPTARDGIALGRESTAQGDRGIAVGFKAQATGAGLAVNLTGSGAAGGMLHPAATGEVSIEGVNTGAAAAIATYMEIWVNGAQYYLPLYVP